MNSSKWYRDTLFKVLSSSQLLFKWKNRQAVKVLAYHDITDVDAFERQIRYLKKSYNIISIHDLEDYIYYQKPLPLYSVLITFDDGDMSMYTCGLPIFKKYDIPAVIFIITGLINTNIPFWWKLVQEYFTRRGEPHLGRNGFPLFKRFQRTYRISTKSS
jgi:peptidoglycan/xylan/chitin deacetylase (PgdA/CDA1 family)